MTKKVCVFFLVFSIAIGFVVPSFGVTTGDVDGDGDLTASDARFILRVALDLESLSSTEKKLADTDKDGEITAYDARIVLRAAIGLESLSDSSSPSDKPLVVGYPEFSGVFSPFYSETAYDQDVWAMTTASLLGVDREGSVVLEGASGETREYNGKSYSYSGIADVTITENRDGSVDYDFSLRDDVFFSDGRKLTVDDVIFSMYVLADPTYDGSATFFKLPIVGMDEYRAGMDTLLNLIYEGGREYTENEYFTEEEMNAFWEKYDAATVALAREIVDCCIENYGATDVASAAAMWGFSIPYYGTVWDFADVLSSCYGSDIVGMIRTENAGSTVDDLFPDLIEYSGKGIAIGRSAPNIRGIIRTGDYSLRIRLTEIDATAIYNLGVAIAPMHYYGSSSKYDYNSNKFGFDKGDLSSVRAKTAQPLGAGPYKFAGYNSGTVYFEANDDYYLGKPKTRFVRFKEVSDYSSLFELVNGTIDVASPSFSKETAKTICEHNSNGALTGNKLSTFTVNNLGYGYLGISAKAVKVGNDIGSEASKNLRKAFATVFANFREESVESYYGDAAKVINYPISDTSWAAPRPSDSDYSIAFSKDVNGNNIFSPGMSSTQRTEAALNAALGFFRAAGYTINSGRVVSAPAGASLTYEVWIPGDGVGDHPSYLMVCQASIALSSIGINLIVKDLANSADLWDALDVDGVPMWCAAWGSTPDPDMFQIYYADIRNGGRNAGSSNYMYDIADEELDDLILDARSSLDKDYRKGIYKECLDIIADWAVEIPVYQRQNAVVFSSERVKLSTVSDD
ncbi:MAG: hypothetical protein K5647_00850, partial [Clostridiales bacterium]|nr:hypothetical protein [Clostridiales bacterium]